MATLYYISVRTARIVRVDADVKMSMKMTRELQALYNIITTALRYKGDADSTIEFYWDELAADLSAEDFERAFQWFCDRGIIATHDIGYKSNEHATATGSMSARSSTPTNTHARKHYRAQVDRKKLSAIFEGKYFVSINDKTHEVLINDSFRVSKPHFNSPNHQFIEYVLTRPNSTITREDVLAAKLDTTQQFKGMIDDLGFEGELKKAFFPQVSNKAIEFRNHLTDEDVKRFGIDEKTLKKQLAKLPKSGFEDTDSTRKRRK